MLMDLTFLICHQVCGQRFLLCNKLKKKKKKKDFGIKTPEVKGNISVFFQTWQLYLINVL